MSALDLKRHIPSFMSHGRFYRIRHFRRAFGVTASYREIRVALALLQIEGRVSVKRGGWWYLVDAAF